MKIDRAYFGFVFGDESWRRKALTAGLLAVVGVVVLPLWLVIGGYSVRLVRQTLRGELPSLPDWSGWRELYRDGARFHLVALVYTLPAWLLVLFAGGVLPLLLLESLSSTVVSGWDALQSLLSIYGTSVLLLIVASLLYVPLLFLARVAQTRMIARDSLRSAFEVGEVWRLMRAGINGFLLAYGLWFAVFFLATTIAPLLLLTVVLACLSPVVLGLPLAYALILMAPLYGAVYRQVQSDLAAGADT
jgi:hypothetical protein